MLGKIVNNKHKPIKQIVKVLFYVVTVFGITSVCVWVYNKDGCMSARDFVLSRGFQEWESKKGT